MEKTMKKIFKILGGILLTAGGAAVVYRYYRKEMKKLEEHENRVRETVENAGVSFDKLNEQVTLEDEDEGNTFVKSVATGMFFGERIPEDFLDIDKIFENDVDGIIHLSKQLYKNREFLNFMFELPNYVNGRYSTKNNYPRINEYVKTIKSISEMVNDEIVKGPVPICKPELYVGVRYILDDTKSLESNEDAESSYFLIPQEVYAEYADERHDGLNNFYTEIVGKDMVESEEFKEMILKNDVIDIQSGHFKITDLKVMIKVSFRIATPGGGAGITFLQVPQVACRFVEETQVTSARNKKNMVCFEHIMIHPQVADQLDTELPCTVYENVSGTLKKTTFLI